MSLFSDRRLWVYAVQRGGGDLSPRQRRRYERKRDRDVRREAAGAIEQAAAERAAEVVRRADTRGGAS
jgi:hypothetical protein